MDASNKFAFLEFYYDLKRDFENDITNECLADMLYSYMKKIDPKHYDKYFPLAYSKNNFIFLFNMKKYYEDI